MPYEMHSRNKNMCEICGKCFTGSRNLKYHHSVHTGEKTYHCDICGAKLCRRDVLLNHIRSHYVDPIKCNICNKVIANASVLQKHLLIHTCTSTKHFTCEVCGAQFQRNTHLKRHQKIHPDTKTIRCQVCGKPCDADKLKYHMVLHTGEKPYTCNICGESFQKQALLRDHKIFHMDYETLLCKICGKRKKNIHALRCHMETHSRNKIMCEICGKCFSRSQNLKYHYSVHTGEKPYHCDNCSAKYCRRDELLNHIRSHYVDPIKCDICNKVITNASLLQKHLLIHTSTKRFTCEVCGAQFRTNTHLKRHGFVHSGERPYSCNACFKSFSRKEHLQGHFNSVHAHKLSASPKGVESKKADSTRQNKDVSIS